MRSMLFWLSAPAGWLSWTAALARAAIEKIVMERINGRARTASSDFFICLTSREISYDMVTARELPHTFLTLERTETLLFLAPGAASARLFYSESRVAVTTGNCRAALGWRGEDARLSICLGGFRFSSALSKPFDQEIEHGDKE